MVRYINETERGLWIPLYLLYPYHNFFDEAEMIIRAHEKMLNDYEAKDIAWLGIMMYARSIKV